MRDGVISVALNGPFVVRDRLFQPPFLEQQAAEIGQGRRVARVRFECCGKIFARVSAQLEADPRYAALVEKKGALGTV